MDVYQAGIVLFVLLVACYPWQQAWLLCEDYAWARSHGLQNLLKQKIGLEDCRIPRALISLIGNLLSEDPADRLDARNAWKALYALQQEDGQ